MAREASTSTMMPHFTSMRQLSAKAKNAGPRIAPVHCAAGSDGETNFGVTSLAAPNAASSRVVRYSLTARLAVSPACVFFHSVPGIERCLLASATIKLASTANPSPLTSPAASSFKDALEHATKHVALAELLMMGTRERRVIWDRVLDREPAKPAIGEVYLYLATQRPFRADRERVADNEHPDHQHRINRGPTHLRVKRCQLRIDPTQIKDCSDPADEVIVRNSLIKTE